MTLVSSGEISIGTAPSGGGVTHQVESELGVTLGNQLSFNDANIRSLTRTTSGTQISLSDLYNTAKFAISGQPSNISYVGGAGGGAANTNTATVTVAGNGGYTYNWVSTGSGTIVGQGTAGAYITATPGYASTLSGTLYCTITDAANGFAPISSTTVSWSVQDTSTAAPYCTVAPVLTGTAQVGYSLGCTQGTWGNSPTGYTYTWYHLGYSTVISSAATYTLQSSDVGYQMYCMVTASNIYGNSGQPCSPSSAILPAAPTINVAPVISGTVATGYTLSCSTGTWNNSPSSYAYQWYASSSGNLGGASTQYLSGVAGQSIRCTVYAYNAGGSSSYTTAYTAAVGNIPVNSGSPTISGTASVGQNLFCSTGSWLYTPTVYYYQWYDYTTGAIPGATSSSFLLTSSQQGHQVYCGVYTYNVWGFSATTTSSLSSVVAIAAPTNTSLPYITGSTAIGSTLYASPGVWTGSPTSYSYSWWTSLGTFIGTGTSYVVSGAYAGQYIYISVTATNAGGSTSVGSSYTGTPVAGPPVNTSAPLVTTNSTGLMSLFSTGGWSYTPSSFSYQWLRNGSAIGGATGSSYQLGAADVGYVTTVTVTGTNFAGSGNGTSASGAIPGSGGVGSISGIKGAGVSVTYTPGTVTNSPNGAYHGWYVNGVDMRDDYTSSTSSSYTIPSGHVGQLIYCVIIPYNTFGAGPTITSPSYTIVT